MAFGGSEAGIFLLQDWPNRSHSCDIFCDILALYQHTQKRQGGGVSVTGQ